MTLKSALVPITLALCIATPLQAQETVPAPASPTPQGSTQGNCLPGDKIDGSTAAQAKAKIEAAGYAEVKIVRKGCDNFWHGSGVYDGVPGFMVLAPDGRVMPEGD